MKRNLLLLAIVVLASLGTYSLMAIPAKKQQQRVTLSVSVTEVELILKALSELPLKESGNLYVGLQQQVQNQLSPPQRPKADSTAKLKKP